MSAVVNTKKDKATHDVFKYNCYIKCDNSSATASSATFATALCCGAPSKPTNKCSSRYYTFYQLQIYMSQL